MAKKQTSHGVVRGAEFVPRSISMEGRFGRLFRTLPAASHSDAALLSLVNKMEADLEPPTINPDRTVTFNEGDDAEENHRIDSGYTYLGQFIDHDLTFDPASSLQKINDPDAIVDFRTPRFDLDCVYGRGPEDQPYMYESDEIHLLLGKKMSGNNSDPNSRDLPRANPDPDNVDPQSRVPKRAIIGDKRNDENVIVSQLQATFIRFHNKVADYLLAQNPDTSFEQIQRVVRWHYQWVVINDFLPLIVGKHMVENILPHLKHHGPFLDHPPVFKIYNPKNEPFIPVEFSVAAYRFGHSMVRPFYRLNSTVIQPIFRVPPDFTTIPPILGLNGFGQFPEGWAIDWDLFFDAGQSETEGPNRVQKSYKIDTSLVNPLSQLPEFFGKDNSKSPMSLAFRNLKRGVSFGLPSGQTVARFLGLEPISDSNLKVGKATKEDDEKNKPIVELQDEAGNPVGKEFVDNAPLWFYILAEAQQQFDGNDKTGIHLGPIGGRIVAETFIGLLLGDSSSYLSQYPNWKPEAPFTNKEGKFRMRDLINFALT